MSRKRWAPLLAAALIAAFAVLPAAAAKPKKKAAKKAYDYEKSKYKAYGALVDKEPKTYRFDNKGNPIPPPSKKKKSSKKKSLPAKAVPKPALRSAEAPKDDPPGKSCGSGESCAASEDKPKE